jgi:hypothetical protein
VLEKSLSPLLLLLLLLLLPPLVKLVFKRSTLTLSLTLDRRLVRTCVFCSAKLHINHEVCVHRAFKRSTLSWTLDRRLVRTCVFCRFCFVYVRSYILIVRFACTKHLNGRRCRYHDCVIRSHLAARL